MDPAGLEKLDTGLVIALRAYEESRVAGEPDAAISVNLRFEGDLEPIEALGFETHSVAEDQALGVVRFRDVRALAAHPNVVRIAAGIEPHLDLDTAVADGRVRASTAAKSDGLWFLPAAGGVPLDASPDATGRDVVVAIIDTGIDFTHPAFMRQLTPDKRTRIKRIWDQGMTPAALADCPPVARLVSANTYGVEFDDTEIDAALAGGPAVAHRDCEGHGTHVAAIAAGGVLFPTNGNAAFVGVAPEADIIAVKLLDVPGTIKFRTAAGFGADVSFAARFRDAIVYCIRTAAALVPPKPVVISMSFGNSGEPGDGLDDDAVWLDARLDPAAAPGPLKFPKGAIVVKSSGNNGDPSRRLFAKINFAVAGTITIPFILEDKRIGVDTKFKNCAELLHKPSVSVNFWYRRNFDVVKFALRLPHRPGFSNDMGIGGHLDHSFILRVGPPPSIALVSAAATVHRVTMRHGTEPSVAHPGGGTVRRHNVNLSVFPKVVGSTVSYAEGFYEVRITAPAGTEVFAMGGLAGFARGKFVILRVADTMADGVTALDPSIDVTSEYTSVDTFGQHVITVAAYDDEPGASQHHIASFSSRGPLRDFSDPPGSKPVIATKPDLAAPGVDIMAAESADTKARPLVPTADWLNGIRFVEKDGTSMATPFVAGVVALMLDKKNDLNVTEARAALTTAAAGRPGVNPAPPGTAHERAYGAGMVDGRESHGNT